MQIGEYIRRAGATYGNAPALTEGARSLSFRDFDAATDRLGNALLAEGFAPGDRVGVLMPNGIDCLIAYYALAKSGLVRVSLNVRETAADHRYKLGESGARGLIHDDIDGAEGFGTPMVYGRDAQSAASSTTGRRVPAAWTASSRRPIAWASPAGPPARPRRSR